MNYEMLFVVFVLFYLYPAFFLAGFIICDEVSHSNPDYSSVIFSLVWPFVFYIAFKSS